MADVKPDVKPDVSEALQIRIKMPDEPADAAILFKVKKSTKFAKVAEAWGKQKGVDPEGKRIHNNNWTQTIQDLGLEDNDQIQALQHQLGGGNKRIDPAQRTSD